MKKKTCIFVGSFDPFHEGHASVLRRARELFDEVVVGIGINPKKQYMFTVEERLMKIKTLFPDVTVETYEGLTIDFAHKHGAQHIVKGIRNEADFLYEREQALFNKEHGDIETIFLLAEPGLENVSSTRIRNEINNSK